jgi:hypothetical protein
MTTTLSTTNSTVTFIQYDEPPLKAGEYKLELKQQVSQLESTTSTPLLDPPPTTNVQFAVAGERFVFNPAEISSVFPEDLANGEFAGVLPQVVFSRRTLPWERAASQGRTDATWLAVLVFDAQDAPTIRQVTAQELIDPSITIATYGSATTTPGALPTNYFSYQWQIPTTAKTLTLDYGELPTDNCSVIDVPIDSFSRIAPALADLPFLAHIRETDTTNSEDNTETTLQYAVVMSNRLPQDNADSHAFLVSLEGLGDYLPDQDGNISPNIPTGTGLTTIRLIVYRDWRFFANTEDATVKALLEGLNKTPAPAAGDQVFSSLQFPFAGVAPSTAQVDQALSNQSTGTLSDNDADVLVKNALSMGYVPHNHHLRHAGHTVSWYRGPLVPYPVATTISIPISCADAANKYNPQTGLFDVSYGAAWQLGQLLALQNQSFAAALYNWKKSVQRSLVVAEEQALLEEKLQDTTLLETVLGRRTQTIAEGPPPVPDQVVDWITKLRLLNSIPFNYLVADERMLQPESLRFFYIDENWVDALVDGAFSIGRATTGELQRDAQTIKQLHQAVLPAMRKLRRNPRRATPYTGNTTQQITGCLLHSKIVAVAPRLMANGYSDVAGNNEIPLLRMERLSNDTLICLFDGVVKMVALHEPPEQLHCGVEDGFTTLREVVGTQPGLQYMSDPHGGLPSAKVYSRTDSRTLQIKQTADSIMTKLNTDFAQGLTPFDPANPSTNPFTSAEFALEMIKGVVKVEYQQIG